MRGSPKYFCVKFYETFNSLINSQCPIFEFRPNNFTEFLNPNYNLDPKWSGGNLKTQFSKKKFAAIDLVAVKTPDDKMTEANKVGGWI